MTEHADTHANTYTLENLFESLTDLNTGFDAPSIKHFNESEFRIIMKRCKNNGVKIYGIEAWTSDGQFLDCIVHELGVANDTWFLDAFDKLPQSQADQEIIYNASYSLE